MKLLTASGLVVLVVALSGCLGSPEGATLGPDPAIGPPPSTDNDAILTYDQLSGYGAEIRQVTDLETPEPGAELPESGRVDYVGTLRLPGSVGGTDYSMLGLLTIEMQFASDAFSGAVSNVVDEGLGLADGSLYVGNGTIDRDADLDQDVTYQSDLTGTLRFDEGTEITVDAGLFGDFYSELDAIAGIVAGNLILATEPVAEIGADAAFIAERE